MPIIGWIGMTSRTPKPRARSGSMRLALLAVPVAAVLGLFLSTAPAGASTAAAAAGHGTQTGSVHRTAAGVRTKSAIPDSASGCNQDTCISVVGSGLSVDYVVQTGHTDEETGCAYGEFLVRGGVRQTTNPTCWDNGEGDTEDLYDFYSIYYNINNNSQVCVDYVGYHAPDGKPCETIHS